MFHELNECHNIAFKFMFFFKYSFILYYLFALRKRNRKLNRIEFTAVSMLGGQLHESTFILFDLFALRKINRKLNWIEFTAVSKLGGQLHESTFHLNLNLNLIERPEKQ